MNELALRSTVRELVAVFAAVEADIRSSFAKIVAAEHRLNSAFALAEHRGHMHIDASGHGYHCNFDDPDRAIFRLRTQAWECIIDRLEIRRAMSIKRADELSKQVKDEKEPPEITEELVFAFARQHSDFKTMWTEAVKEVFDWLHPREHTPRAEYKTNQKNAFTEIGPRVILTGCIERGYGSTRYQVRSWSQPRCTALDNVFSGLDGKGTITTTHYGPLGDAIRACGPGGSGETEYFGFRVFRNGNLHIRFKRLDLLEKFNAAAGGLNLKPEAA